MTLEREIEQRLADANTRGIGLGFLQETLTALRNAQGAASARDAALTLLDEFDRYAMGGDPAYAGSPFSVRVAKFLTVNGRGQ